MTRNPTAIRVCYHCMATNPVILGAVVVLITCTALIASVVGWASYSKVFINTAASQFFDFGVRLGYVIGACFMYAAARRDTYRENPFVWRSFGNGFIIACLFYGTVLENVPPNPRDRTAIEEWMMRISVSFCGALLSLIPGMIVSVIYDTTHACIVYTKDECARSREQLSKLD